MVEILYDDPEDKRDQEIEQNMDCCIGVSIPCGFFLASVVIVFIVAQVAGWTLDADSLEDDSAYMFGLLLGLQAVMMIVFTAGYWLYKRRG